MLCRVGFEVAGVPPADAEAFCVVADLGTAIAWRGEVGVVFGWKTQVGAVGAGAGVLVLAACASATVVDGDWCRKGG